ncbi:MAG: hypothetical protein JHD07_30430 [Bradyrhizobium sp.]|uniref:hypothetical protein n=1 Tax=Bradyrhizobium sp. TaxID=376 RepID=UPI001A2A89C3|nr:hypothetical protein [Bradyrhizobium sp.]MBJ7407385.1 hypothetical protein [Bradyrhizobium sp.]
MFSAFSSIDYQSIRARTPAETAAKRLNGIGEVLSSLDVGSVRNAADLAHALWTLETADKCIRMILAEFRTEHATEVARQAAALMGLIDSARDELTGLRTTKS